MITGLRWTQSLSMANSSSYSKIINKNLNDKIFLAESS